MHGCLKAFLIVNTGMVLLVSGCILSGKIKRYKAKSVSPAGRYLAVWYGDGDADFTSSTSAYIYDKQKKIWSTPIWNITEDWALLDESHFSVSEYKCIWRSENECLLVVEGSTPLLGDESRAVSCSIDNTGTIGYSHLGKKEIRALQASGIVKYGPEKY